MADVEEQPGRGSWAVPALLALTFAIFAISWALTTPPLGYPDEADHYLRALAAGRGDLYGKPNPQLDDPGFVTPLPKGCCTENSPNSMRWLAQVARVVSIPEPLLPEHMPCPVASGVPPAPCDLPTTGTASQDHFTTMGTMEPALYVVPGVAANRASSPTAALRLGRLANAILCSALLTMAAFAIADRRGSPLALVGLIAAATPMVLFIAGSMSPSAIEISAGIAFFALLLRASRDVHPPRAIWLQLGIAGIALAVSRSLGPVWIALDIALVAALIGPKQCWDAARASRLLAIGTAGAVSVAALTTVAWERLHQPSIAFDLHFFMERLRPSLRDLPTVGRQLVGVFGGSLDIAMSPLVYAAWATVTAILVLAALAVGSTRERLVLLAAGALNVAVAVVVSAGVLNQTGFGLQGRHVLAFAATAPLLAGEIVYRRRDRIRAVHAAVLAGLVATGCAATHAAAFRTASRGYGWLHDHGSSAALPPGGTTLWVIAIAVGTLSLAAGTGASALLARLRRIERDGRAQSGPVDRSNPSA